MPEDYPGRPCGGPPVPVKEGEEYSATGEAPSSAMYGVNPDAGGTEARPAGGIGGNIAVESVTSKAFFHDRFSGLRTAVPIAGTNGASP